MPAPPIPALLTTVVTSPAAAAAAAISSGLVTSRRSGMVSRSATVAGSRTQDSSQVPAAGDAEQPAQAADSRHRHHDVPRHEPTLIATASSPHNRGFPMRNLQQGRTHGGRAVNECVTSPKRARAVQHLSACATRRSRAAWPVRTQCIDQALPGVRTTRRRCDDGHNRHISIMRGMTGVMSTGRRNVAMTEGTQQTGSDNTAVRAFQVGFPEAELTELRRRVSAARCRSARRSPTTRRACGSR